jgi:hypothetical protein
MHRIPIVLVRTGVLLTGLLVLTGAAARTANFDGRWSVLVITESGTCDAAYRYGVTVENGVVRYRGESGIDVRGSVDDHGRVRVAIGRGEQRAEGTGQLSQDGGSGTWSGSSSANRCRGRWEAERR